MIERFNFYDIYGYLLPGLTLLILFWLPFALTLENWQVSALLSTLVALVLGYIIGHFLQILGTTALPSTQKDADGERRHPSYIILGEKDKTFSDEIKKRIEDRILSEFGIDVSDGGDVDTKVRERRRQDAFLLCRTTLIRKGAAGYAEQFQGMYVFMRGLVAAFGLASTYHLGWVLGGFLDLGNADKVLYYKLLAALSILFILAYLTEDKIAEWLGIKKLVVKITEWLGIKKLTLAACTFWLVGSILLVLGGLFSAEKQIGSDAQILFFIISLTSLLISFKCYGAYHRLAWTFAKTVYQDFSVV